jgi:hypothetical protein
MASLVLTWIKIPEALFEDPAMAEFGRKLRSQNS